jgi:hypothetical protein
MRTLLAAIVLAACGADADGESTSESTGADAVCYRVTTPIPNPSCCRDSSLDDWFNPPEPVCWESEALYESYRVQRNAAERSGECKISQHTDEPCVFE